MYSKDETLKLRKEFWTSFTNYTKFYSQKIGHPIQWLLYRTGIKGIELKFDIENKFVRVVLDVNCKNDDLRFDMFVELDKYKNIIEAHFNEPLIWNEEFELAEAKIVSRIYLEKRDVYYLNIEHWPEIFKFMAENMYLLQNNFMEIHPILENKFGQ